MRLLFLVFIFSTSLLYSQTTVKIGVLAKRGADITLEKWAPTADYLSQNIPDHKFEILPLAFEEIITSVQNKEVDFILANPGFYVELEYKYGVQRISTLVNKHLSGLTQQEFGGILLTHSDNKLRYNKIEDLLGSTLAAVNEKSLGGWQMAWRELVENEIDIKDDIKSLTFKGTHDKVVYAVLNKEVDVGTVRTDTIERMAMEGKIDLNKLHFIATRKYEGFPFLISTKLYPEWPIAKLKHTPDELSKQVAITLMQMSPDEIAAKAAKISGWNTPLSYQPVHQCFKTLEIPPYFNEIHTIDVLKKYWGWIIFYLLIALGVISMLVRQIQLTKHLKETQSELVETEKMASLGRLVAGVAHEINTPIGVGVTAASFLENETKKFNLSYEAEEVTQESFEAYMQTTLKTSQMILTNLNRASELIQSFKQISVDQSSDEHRPFILKSYIEQVIESLNPELKKTTHSIKVTCVENIMIDSIPGVFSQIFSNLIMNSLIHGFEHKDNGRIAIIITKNNEVLNIVYKDDGRGLNKENLSKIFDPFYTTKRGNGGSGLGTHIVYNLVTQKLFGTIKAESEVDKGLTFIMNFKGMHYV